MYLHAIGSSDPRFKGFHFHDGMNIVLAERSSDSDERNSRNGAGKSSLVLVMRYLLGGATLDTALSRVHELRDSSFFAEFCTREDGVVERVERPVSAREIYLREAGGGFKLESDVDRNWWLNYIARNGYGLQRHDGVPGLENLYGQVFRTTFEATKVEDGESKWKGTTRLGYFMGFPSDALDKSREASRISNEKRTVTQALKSSTLSETGRDQALIEAELVAAKSKRDALTRKVKNFRVDEQYAEHQDRANQLTWDMRDVSDTILVCEERIRLIEEAIATEEPASDDGVKEKVKSVYEEAGLLLPEVVLRRYDEVEAFHASVIRNRKLYLSAELEELKDEVRSLREEQRALDEERSSVMKLLDSTVALETYESVVAEVAELEAQVRLLQKQLTDAKRVESMSIDVTKAKLDAHAALEEQKEAIQEQIDAMASEFSRLSKEVYHDREGLLTVKVTKAGNLSIKPKIPGDNSGGISGVKTFLLDMVVLRNAMKLGRAPKILVHDSELFNGMDERQLGSCLNIAARLSEEDGFQYVVLLNSDTLTAAEHNGFDRGDYVLSPVLSDSGDDGGLFGFRFA